jgi:serine/threonine protein kinase/tetratricopeptide (TPR) repeat protein
MDPPDDRTKRRPFESGQRGANLSGAPEIPPGFPVAPPRTNLPGRVGHYAIERKLGEGGMGVVYAAQDDRLRRAVAVKMISSPAGDELARERFWREARTAASVNHPNVCQIYEIGEDEGRLFIAMELLDGEVLTERLQRGALTVPEALPIAFGMLAALSALHARGIIHRDLKPSNVFLTGYGVKLLDFGLARFQPQPLDPTLGLTGAGTLLGTPKYMAPEQVTGASLDYRCDLFAAGSILFEMLAGRPAFPGRTLVDILHATLHEQPPALAGTAAVAAVDRVIHRALAKRPADRPASADAMAEELRAVPGGDGGKTAVLARPFTRLVVLPFRVLRPDSETDFLAFSLPDAVATSLSGVGSMIVRSSAVAARFAAETPDLKVLAAEADVDHVVTGTLLRIGDQLRVVAQLVEAPGGTLLGSEIVQSSLGDLFRLQDDIARRLVDALSLPLAAASTALALDAPHDARAYEFYLRANEMARTFAGFVQARDLYERCLELDSRFAPAWARLGRCRRLIGKFIDIKADSQSHARQALDRALELNPRLTIAHKLYANLEAETGQPTRALARLLGEANRHGNDPELFAGLVHACRYCGLLDESIAAHAEARRLDPNVPTSLEQTMLMTLNVERLLAVPRPVRGGDDEWIIVRIVGLGMDGRGDEARRELAVLRQAPRVGSFQGAIELLQTWLDRRLVDMRAHLSTFNRLTLGDDPEFVFRVGWMLCDLGEHEEGLALLRTAVVKGYFVTATLAVARQFDPLRNDSRFQAIVAEAEACRQQALTAFRDGGGERLLGG